MPRNKSVELQVNTTIRNFDDKTVVTVVKEITKNGDSYLISSKKSIKQDKASRKKNNEREIVGETVKKQYNYDDRSVLEDVKVYRFTDKNKEKRLEQHTVESISAPSVSESGGGDEG